jgi:hypothetical protein
VSTNCVDDSGYVLTMILPVTMEEQDKLPLNDLSILIARVLLLGISKPPLPVGNRL